MSRPRGIALALVAAVLLGAPQRLRADEPLRGPSVREAADHFGRGVKLYEEHDWRAALIEFERAYAVAPHYAVLYNVGQCRYQLQDYAGSLAAFEKFLAEGGTTGAAETRRRAEATLDDLRKRVARVAVTTDIEGAEITVDDVVVGTTPLASPLVVSEGRRKIAASKAGRATATRNVDLAGNDSTELSLHLEPLEPADAANAPPATVPLVPSGPPPRGGRPIAPTIVTFGLAAGGIGVGAVFGLIAVGDKNGLDAECDNRRCPPSSESRVEALKRNSILSTIGFSVGAAGLVAGAGYLLLSPARSDSGRVHPFLGPGVAGAAGSFW
ncbi:MAG: PEGA domain-containing protein [Polyangiaceae bacterium]